MGKCNKAKDAVTKCLREARANKSHANREQGTTRMAKVRTAWKDIDENS